MEQQQPSGSIFNFADLCFICTKRLDRSRKKCMKVPNDQESRDRLLRLCCMTGTDQSEQIKERLESVPSLISVKASYHSACYGVLSRAMYPDRYKQVDIGYEEALRQVYEYIINSNKQQFNLTEFKNIMKDKFRSNDALYKALKNHFGQNLIINQGKGKSPQFLFKQLDIGSICRDWHYDKEHVSDAAKNLIIKVAADLLKSDISAVKYSRQSYPPADQFLQNVESDIPNLLKDFLDYLMEYEDHAEHPTYMMKRNSMAHSIISVIKPKSFNSTLQLAVGTYIYRKTGSRIIIDMLSKLGVSATYKAIQLYEASTIIHPATFDTQDTFVQFVFDNTDHNVSTLDGKETFHCLGGIGVYTPSDNVYYSGRTKKLGKMPSASAIAAKKQIRTIHYRPTTKPSLNDITYVSVSSMDLQSSPLLPRHYGAYLWAKHLEVPEIPSWKGFMEIITSHMDYTISHVACLPFINEPPSNLSTLNTSLHHALQETNNQNQKTCFVTYDQPLYLKARSIVSQSSDSSFQNVIVRLGGFHLLMSYIGAIGHIMGGSGLDDLWSTIYAAQSTKKMMTGHAYSRSVRAHVLTFTALGMLACETVNAEKEQHREVNEGTQRKFEDYVQLKNNLTSIFTDWCSEPPFLEDLEKNDNVKILCYELESYLETVSAANPTAKLWVQYFKSVSVALQFIEAERLGDWKLHLLSVKRMLPLFHASGHFAYAKSAQIYLQDMVQLELTMDPIEYEQFTTNGFFTIRRSHKAWSGVWSDMTIEQTLNRFFGTDLKHGRGVTPSVVSRYLLGMPAAFGVMDSLENFLNITTANSEQHTDLSANRMGRDAEDIASLLLWFREHNPFTPRINLISLSTGIMGNTEINCHTSYEIGRNGMATMVGKTAEVSLTKLYKVRNLLNAKSLHIEDTSITIDPLMLFQRISLVIHGDEKKMREAFRYELSPYPLSLFNEQGLMRKTTKAQLYSIFTPYMETDSLLRNSPIVIDGGWLLHQISWPHSRTFGEIFELYYSYIVNHFGNNVTVVFDGYYSDVIGVKSYERYRRKEKTVGADICIAEENVNTLTQSKFLSNTANKVKLVDKLHAYLQSKEIKTEIAAEDADCLIVNIALKQSESSANPIIIVGNDVDLFILLVALASDDKPIYFYKIAGGKAKNTLYSSKDQNNKKPFILFAHAFAGCDSTSAFYKKGKKNIIKILQAHSVLRNEIKTFYAPNSTIDDLYPVCEKIVQQLYCPNKKNPSTMKSLRYDCFKAAVSSAKKDISLSTLPPTITALIQHVKRVYYQIQLWLGNSLNPEDWGWRRTQMMLIPILDSKQPAPNSLLQLIRCGCNGDCTTRQCTCKNMGLKCNHLCRQCNGLSCMNGQTTRVEELYGDSEDEDDLQDQQITIHERRDDAVAEKSNSDARDDDEDDDDKENDEENDEEDDEEDDENDDEENDEEADEEDDEEADEEDAEDMDVDSNNSSI